MIMHPETPRYATLQKNQFEENKGILRWYNADFMKSASTKARQSAPAFSVVHPFLGALSSVS